MAMTAGKCREEMLDGKIETVKRQRDRASDRPAENDDARKQENTEQDIGCLHPIAHVEMMLRAREKDTRITAASMVREKASLRSLGYVRSLRSLLAFGDLELDLIAFLQTLVSFGSNCAVVHKNVGAVIASDEAVSLCVIEPLYCSFQAFHLTPPFLARPFVGDLVTCPTVRMHFVAIRMGCQG